MAHEAAFASALTDPAQPPPATIEAHSGATRRRFAVYRNNVVVGLIEALRARFPAVERLVGEAFFAAAARVFAAAHPPRSALMMTYGEDFPEFLARFPPAAELGFLADVARLETARTRAYHAPDATAIAPARLMALAPEALATLRLAIHPSATVIRSAHPVVLIWAMNAGETPVAAIDDWRAQDALVTRPRATVDVCALPPGGAAFLLALMRGDGLADAAASADALAFDLAANLSALLTRGLIVDIAQGATP